MFEKPQTYKPTDVPPTAPLQCLQLLNVRNTSHMPRPPLSQTVVNHHYRQWNKNIYSRKVLIKITMYFSGFRKTFLLDYNFLFL